MYYHQSKKCNKTFNQFSAGICILILTAIFSLTSISNAEIDGRVVFHEDWKFACDMGQYLAGIGQHHCQLQNQDGEEAIIAFAERLKFVCRNQDSIWLIDEAGNWFALNESGLISSWNPGLKIISKIQPDEYADDVWLLTESQILRVKLAAHPQILDNYSFVAGLDADLRSAGGEIYVRSGRDIYLFKDNLFKKIAVFPEPVKNWFVHNEMIYCLDYQGRLGMAAGLSAENHSIAKIPVFPFDTKDVKSLLVAVGAIWIQNSQNEFWILGEHNKYAVKSNFGLLDLPGPDDFPVNENNWILQNESCRKLVRIDASTEIVEYEIERQAALLDRHFRYSGTWELQTNGSLYVKQNSGRAYVGNWPSALGLCFYGGGVLLITDNGFASFTENALQSSWNMHNDPGAWDWTEDYFFMASADSLFSYWCGDQFPLFEDVVEIQGIRQLSVGNDWLVARSAESLYLLDKRMPWDLSVIDSQYLEAGAGEIMVYNECLLIASESGLLAFNLAESGISENHLPRVHTSCSWLAKRGANRLLLLDENGLLSQARINNNLPVALDWQVQLPIAGKMDFRLDSLRVLNSSAYLDLALPALEYRAESIEVQLNSTQINCFPNPCNPTTMVNLPSAGKQHRQLELYDLLGRRLNVFDIQPSQEMFNLDLSAHSSGLYFILLKSDDQGIIASGKLFLTP
jgi:hypothetical protein